MGWRIASLGSLVEASAPIRYGIVQIGPDTPNGVPIVPIKHLRAIKRGSLHRAARPIERRYARSRVRHNDVLLSVKGTIGHVGLVPEGFVGNIAREIARIRPRDGVIPQFIAYQLEYNRTQERIHRAVVGTTRQEFSIAAVRKFEIALPPAPEQRAISEALSDVDALLGALGRVIVKKRDLKQAAMQELLSGRTRLPGFAEEWAIKRIGEFAHCVAGGTPSTQVGTFWHGPIRWMNSGDLHMKRVSEVEGRITALGLQHSSAKMLPEYCVLLGLAGQGKTRGTVAINCVELCTNQSIAAIFPSIDHVPEYLYYNLDARYDELRELSAGDGGRGGLNLTLIRSMLVSLPPICEQRAIAAVLSDMDAEIDALEQRRAKTTALKQGMMQELLTGRTRLV